MSTNLLELLNAHLTEDVVLKVSNIINESPKDTGSALGGALPALLSGLLHKSADSQGASILYNLLIQNYDSGLLSNLGASLLGGDMTAKLLNTGSSLLNSIFGTKAEGIANAVANTSGISKNSSTSLLGLLMPIIFAVLGKTIKSQQINTPLGLVSLLNDQAGFLKNLLPAGLAGIFGASVADLTFGNSAHQSTVTSAATSTTTITPVVDADVKPTVETKPTPVVIAKEPESISIPKIPPPPYTTHDDDDVGIFGKLLPWLILGSILALGWGIWQNLKKSGDTAPATASSADKTATPAATAESSSAQTSPVATPVAPTTSVITEPTPAVTDAATKAPAPTATATTDTSSSGFVQKLSSGYEIKALADGMESKLLTYLADAKAKIDKNTWFTLNGVNFDTNKATLRSDSEAQIKNVVEILKAYPKVKIKIGGYTDNTGNAKSNKKLSQDRANAIEAALVKAGIDKARLAAEGYGSDHPLASNDTPEGRQQNRRIDLRVTAK